MPKIKKRVFSLLLLIGGMFYFYETQPLIQPEEKIRKNMLEKFPIGTDKQVVRSYAKALNNFYMQGTTGWWKDDDQNNKEIIGSSNIVTTVQDLHLIYVSIIWVFDSEDHLYEVYVKKEVDLL